MRIAVHVFYLAVLLFVAHGTAFLVLTSLELRGRRIPPRLRRLFLPHPPPPDASRARSPRRPEEEGGR